MFWTIQSRYFFPWNKGCTGPFLSHFKWLLGRLRATYAFLKLAKKEILWVKICYKTAKCVCPEGVSEWRAIIIWTQNFSTSEITTDVIQRNLFRRHIKATCVKQPNWLCCLSWEKGNFNKSLHFYYFFFFHKVAMMDFNAKSLFIKWHLTISHVPRPLCYFKSWRNGPSV